MTAPDLSFLIPSKAKAWVALIGTGLSFVVPYVLSAETFLPKPVTAGIGVALWILSVLGVYKVPNVPADSVVVAKADIPAVVAAAKQAPPAEGEYRNPYPQ